MHKRRWNALKLELVIEPRAPLLIKSGLASPNPSLPDMQFVRTMTPQGETVFIPGSSLKGTFRSFTEKVLRTAKADGACEPFPSSPEYCGRRLGREENPATIYKRSCRACRMYGNTRLRGRLSFTDAFPEGAVKTETRYGVAISRLTNAVAVGPFDMEVLVQGRFRTALVLENFEVWQMGLLALTLQAINDGLVKLGFGKNRGFGEVSITVEQAVVELAKKPGLPQNAIWGAGAFVDDGERKDYGLQEGDRLEDLPEGMQIDFALFVRRTYDREAWRKVAEKAMESLPHILEAA
ncbi:RAMP superfamily CRISPR-associated protein [Thermoflexus sp.]|uniref:RAMP superfamily CRISPR-associated protein n=1 Tax=Thermoflexus sp. TaxID=1969742 RepID=UPI0035E442A1